MKISHNEVADLLRNRVSVIINLDAFRFSEILTFAEIARNRETKLSIKVGTNINADELLLLAKSAGKFVLFDFTD